MPLFTTIERLTQMRLIPVVRYDTADVGALAIDALIRAGFGTIEITLTMPDALDLIREFGKRGGNDVVVGAGTIWDESTAQRAIDAGAAYLVSPGLVPGLGAVVKSAKRAYLPGVLTPSEVAFAIREGADAVKIFPAASVGGPKHLGMLKPVFPQTLFCPTGGVNKENMHEYLASGAAMVGIGATLFSREALLARKSVTLVNQAREHLDVLSLIPRK